MSDKKNSKEETYMFDVFFDNYIKKIYSKIESIINCEKINIRAYNCLYNDLYSNLFKLAIKSLIRELHFYKDSGLLKGATKEERYTYFEQKTAENEFVIKFFKTYPELKRLINDYIACVSLYIGTIINDFSNDRGILQNFFNVRLDKITDISIGKGDTHNGGKSVAIVYFESCQMVYKPHSLKADYILEQILNWMNQKNFLSCKLSAVKTLSINDRGWQEFIKQLPCNNQNEVNEYYYKMGCFLALFQTIGTTDLHFENVIAFQTNPMFIDMETIFTNNRRDRMYTVLNTGLLPQVSTDYLIDVDISGICGKSIKSQKMKMMVIQNRKTDEMLVDEVQAVVEERQNLVFYDNKVVESDYYSDIIISGYQTVLDFLMDNSEEFVELLDKNISDDAMFRTVLRHTQVYSKYLSVAVHPDYLISTDKRRELFQRLRMNCKDRDEYSRVDDEIATLMSGDIPYFMFDYRSKNLYSNNGLLSEHYFLYSARDIIISRMKKLSVNRDANIRLIRKSLYTAFPQKDKRTLWNDDNKKGRTNNSLVLDFAEEIESNVFYEDNEKVALFFINCLYNNKISLESININLYEGGGIILYLAAVGKSYNNIKYLDDADKLLNTVTELIKYKSSDNNYPFTFSAFYGLGSLIYLNYLLYFMTKDVKYKDEASIAFDLINDKNLYNRIDQNKNYDYLGGISGVIVFMAHVLQKLENEDMKHMCLRMAKMLEDYISRTVIDTIGLAHGLSGYAYAFVMLFKITNRNHYIEIAKKLLLKEDEQYLINKPTKVSWCKGESGMCLVRLKFLELNTCSQIYKKFLSYYRILITDGLYQLNNMCLCHGVYGNIEIIEKINQTEIVSDNKKISSQKLKRFKDSLPNNLQGMYIGFHKDFKTEIFMTGLSGIFYSILREENENLPSILFLEI